MVSQCSALEGKNNFGLSQDGYKKSNAGLHKFPKALKLSKDWNQLNHSNSDSQEFSDLRLCLNNFRPYQFQKDRLIINAVPSIFKLPDHCEKSEVVVTPSAPIESKVLFNVDNEQVSIPKFGNYTNGTSSFQISTKIIREFANNIFKGNLQRYLLNVINKNWYNLHLIWC